MDPIATLRELLYAVLCEDGERAEELAEALHEWLQRGGFSPVSAQVPLDYQGWKNFETCAVHRWLTNDEGSDGLCRALAQQAIVAAQSCGQVLEGTWRIEEAPRRLLVEELKEFLDSRSPLRDDTSVYADLLGSAMYKVDWDAIAEAFLE